ncbi:MAG: hypothetical protein RMM58_07820 [Chloroflexota bacterium]|nr:hypothetical protein [Dehalococcoidia bacterium]MDW8253768.1 hypothetical protein [Chloroflexota bacterium]
MKIRLGIAALLLAAAVFRLGALADPAGAAAYFVQGSAAWLWAVVSGGGGVSTGTAGGQPASLYGVIGQPIVGRTSGAWTVDAGFLIAAEQPFYYLPFTSRGVSAD